MAHACERDIGVSFVQSATVWLAVRECSCSACAAVRECSCAGVRVHSCAGVHVQPVARAAVQWHTFSMLTHSTPGTRSVQLLAPCTAPRAVHFSRTGTRSCVRDNVRVRTRILTKKVIHVGPVRMTYIRRTLSRNIRRILRVKRAFLLGSAILLFGIPHRVNMNS